MTIRLLTLSALWLMFTAVACGQSAPYFDGHKAFGHLEDQVAIGPRYSGSVGHDSLRAYLENYLQPRAHELVLHETQMPHPYENSTLFITNYLARFNPNQRERIMLLAHYDTRPYADEELDPKKQTQPILGANDAASGVAVLLELADMMAAEAPSIGVDLLFVDAEDIGRPGDSENYALGTQKFVADMDKVLGGVRPRYAVLLDMVGDAELTFPIEYYSWRGAPKVVSRIWGIAADLGYDQFQNISGTAIIDDHIPFLEAGIPAVDIIDMDYPNQGANYWHTLEDTPDKCSPESLEAVGTVMTALIYEERP